MRKFLHSLVSTRKYTIILLVILALHVSWRTNLAYNYPLFDMSDELFHFDYVYRLSEGQGLIDIYKDPITVEVFDLAKSVGHWEKENIVTPEAIGAVTPEIIDSIHAWGWYAFDITGGSSYEGVQPPLYYIFSAFFVRLTDSMIAKAYIARGVTVMFSALTLVAYYYLIKKVTQSEFIALGAVALLASLPSWSFQAFRIGNDMAAQFFVAASLLFFCHVYTKKTETSIKNSVILGIIVGLAGLTKLTSLIVILPSLAACYIFIVKKPSIQKIKHFAAICLISGAICFWFYARNYALYGDFSGTQAIIRAIYLEKLVMPQNILQALQHFVGVVYGSAFFPYTNAYDQTLYLAVTTIWIIVPIIAVIRGFFDIVSQSKLFNQFKKKMSYISRNDSSKILSLLMLSSGLAITVASLQFMMTISIDLSERYLMVISGLAAGYVIYGWKTLISSTRIKVISLLAFCLLLAFASISHELNLISMYLNRLQP